MTENVTNNRSKLLWIIGLVAALIAVMAWVLVALLAEPEAPTPTEPVTPTKPETCQEVKPEAPAPAELPQTGVTV